jgi:hypothetical protein
MGAVKRKVHSSEVMIETRWREEGLDVTNVMERRGSRRFFINIYAIRARAICRHRSPGNH